jgi:hypothetical protein
MSTPIFDQLVREFEARRGVKYQTLLAPTTPPTKIEGVRPTGIIVDEAVNLFKTDKPIKPVTTLIQRGAA